MKLKYTLGILLIFILLSCSTVTASMMPGFEPGKAETTVNLYRGELVGKYYGDHHNYVEIYNEDKNEYYSSLYVSKNECLGAIMGEEYEWKRINYPDGRESVSFHRI